MVFDLPVHLLLPGLQFLQRECHGLLRAALALSH